MNNFSQKKIPKGWLQQPLSKVCDVLIGGTPARNNPELWDENKTSKNVWVSIADLSKLNSKYISDSSEYISDLGIKKSNVKLMPENTILMSFKLSIGKMAIAKKPLYTNEAIAGFFPKTQDLVPSYLFYILPKLAYDTDTAIKGKTLNKEKIRNVLITLPPKPEQEKIAEILGAVDEDIEKTDAIIEKTEKLKKGLMQELLTRGISHKKFKKTKLGEIPEEWEIGKFSQLASPRKEKFDPKINKSQTYIGLENLDQNSGILLGTGESSNALSLKSIFKKGDILFGKLRPYLRKYWLAEFEGVCTTEILVFVPKVISDSNFILQIVQSDGFISKSHSSSFGTKMPRTDWNIISNYELPIPPVPERIKIGEILSAIDDKISTNKQLKNKLLQLKKGLMADLLSGKIRV